jgi:hypothetical protein
MTRAPIAVLGELDGAWFQVDAPAAQHRDQLDDQVGVGHADGHWPRPPEVDKRRARIMHAR